MRTISNASERETSPVLYEDGIVYLSNRIVPSTVKYLDANDLPPLDIYYAEFFPCIVYLLRFELLPCIY